MSAKLQLLSTADPPPAGTLPLGPLTWVLSDLRQSIPIAIMGLRRAALESRSAAHMGDSWPDDINLFAARRLFEQAAGALAMIGQSEAAKIFTASRAAVEAFIHKPGTCTEEAVTRIQRASQAVINFSQAHLNGQSFSPVALFPSYRAVHQIHGTSHFHPADLWPPIWYWHTLARPTVSPLTGPAGSDRMAVFDKALLGCLRSWDPASAQQITALCSVLAQSGKHERDSTYWHIAAGFFEAVSLGLLGHTFEVKRTIADLRKPFLQQLGASQWEQHAHEMVFFCACVHPHADLNAPHLQAVRQGFGLEGTPIIDYQIDAFTERDPQRWGVLGQKLDALIDLWASLAGGDSLQIPGMIQQLASLSGLSSQLAPASAELLRELMSYLTDLRHTGQAPDSAMTMEVAIALLTLQAACEDPYAAGDLLDQRCQQLARRLRQTRKLQHAEALDEWMLKVFHRGATERSMTSLVSALSKVLQGIEMCLERYFAEPGNTRPLRQALEDLDQADGIFAMLGLEQAHLATSHLRGQISEIVQQPTSSGTTPPATQALWAANLGALAVVTDALVFQPALAKTIFYFDAAAGQLVSSASPTAPQTASRSIGSESPTPLNSSQTAPVPAAKAPSPTPAAAPADEADADIMVVFFTEVTQLLAQAEHTIQRVLARAEGEIQTEDIRIVRRAFHTLKGASRMVGLNALGEAAWAFEELCNPYVGNERELDRHVIPLSHQALLCFREWIEAVKKGQSVKWSVNQFRDSADALRLQGIMRPLRTEPTARPAAQAYRQVGPLRLSENLFQVFIEEAADRIALLEQLALPVMVGAQADTNHLQSIHHVLHAIQGSAATVGFSGLAAVAHATDQVLRSFTPSATAQVPVTLQPCIHEMDRLLKRFAAGFLDAARPDVLDSLQTMVSADPAPRLEPDGDKLDADLWPTFRDEGRELMPALDRALRMWAAQPENTPHADHVRRLLHTIKGSARSAGATHLGKLAHSLESYLSSRPVDLSTEAWLSTALEDLDTMLAHFDQLQGLSASGLASAPETQAPSIDSQLPISRPTVRVGADNLDRILSQCSDVLVAHSRMQSRAGSMLVTLDQLALNASRLREQLRALEIQSDLHIQSRSNTADGHGAALDPLELDRFTRLQEISRMMAESTEDLGALNKNLREGLSELDRDLVLQKRHGQELQQEVLGMRLVAFDGVSDRLYAAVRQAAKHASRSVRLDIKGSGTEVDRSMLERLAPCLEHMVRNAVVHGIETVPERLASGKPPTGEISVAIQQIGQHVHIDVRDDGMGLRKDRIQAKAIAQGLLARDADLNDDEAVALLVRSGFSTSDDVNMFSGRGVGMDVVQSEVRAMGGHLTVQSQPGRGLCFSMVFPITTGLTQVVLFRVGDLIFGAPRAMLLQVLQQPALPAPAAAKTLQLPEHGEVDLFWAGDLLEGPDPAPLEIRHLETIAVFGRPGSVVALQVTEVLGDREMAVKDLGSQLSKLPALVTVSPLPTGDLVLIYDPLALAQVYGKVARRRQLTRAATHQHEAAQVRPAGSVQITILVVDDSITVRRVTQRLLTRESMHVVLANNGLDALDKMKTLRPDLILSDIEMPHMDGFDLVRAVRADPRSADIPVIIISSRVGQKHRDIALALGVNHYLGKPYSEEALLALVRTYFREKALT